MLSEMSRHQRTHCRTLLPGGPGGSPMCRSREWRGGARRWGRKWERGFMGTQHQFGRWMGVLHNMVSDLRVTELRTPKQLRWEDVFFTTTEAKCSQLCSQCCSSPFPTDPLACFPSHTVRPYKRWGSITRHPWARSLACRHVDVDVHSSLIQLLSQRKHRSV